MNKGYLAQSGRFDPGREMDIRTIRAFFGWCALINYLLILLWFFLMVGAHDWFQSISYQWLRFPKDQFDTFMYEGIAAYKIGNMMLFLAPFLSLSILCKRAKTDA